MSKKKKKLLRSTRKARKRKKRKQRRRKKKKRIKEQKLGMAMGRVRGGFLYAKTHPTGLPSLPKPTPFNKRVFKAPNRPVRSRAALSRHAWPKITNTNTQITNTKILDL